MQIVTSLMMFSLMDKRCIKKRKRKIRILLGWRNVKNTITKEICKNNVHRYCIKKYIRNNL